MGLFKRQTAQSVPQPPSDPEVVVGDEDLSACASALGDMEEALLGGSDAGIRSSASAIAWAGGVRPSGDLLTWVVEHQMRDPSAKPLDRPWYWLVAVAEEATKRGDLGLSGRVGFFLHGWSEHVAPKMGLADQEDCGGLMSVPREPYAKGLGCAVRALTALDANEIVVKTREQAVPAGRLLTALSETLLRLDQAGAAVDPDARTAALQAST